MHKTSKYALCSPKELDAQAIEMPYKGKRMSMIFILPNKKDGLTKLEADLTKFDSTTGFTFALELVAKSYFLNLKIVEIPSTWIEIKNRKSNFKVLKWIPYYIYWLLYSTVKNYTLKIRNFFK